MAKRSVQKPARASAYYSSVEFVTDWREVWEGYQTLFARVCQASIDGILKQREMNAWKRTGTPIKACADWWNTLPRGTRVAIDHKYSPISGYPTAIPGSKVRSV